MILQYLLEPNGKESADTYSTAPVGAVSLVGGNCGGEAKTSPPGEGIALTMCGSGGVIIYHMNSHDGLPRDDSIAALHKSAVRKFGKDKVLLLL